MELISTTTALSGLMMLILVSFLGHKARGKSINRRPPGPWALPFIGCIHHLLTSQPQAALRDLAQKHGPVMYLKLGQVDAVVISSPAAAQEALRDKDLSLASRPSLLGSEIICYGNRDIAFAPYGDYWRSLRKLCAVELLSAAKVRQFAVIRDSETMSLVREIRAAAAAAAGGGRGPVDIGGLLLSCSNSITGRAAFGNRCSKELKADFLSAISVVIINISGFCVSDLFPSLRFVDALTGTKRRLLRAHQQLEDVFGRIISEGEARREERKKKGTAAGEDDDDLLSVMLRIRDEGKFEIPINNTNIKAIILDLFTAGTETTSSAAEWLMTELMRNPDAMQKAQEEVRQALKHRSPDEHESQMDKLHYTRMVIKETLRLYPSLPLLLPRQCRETCDIGGYEVPKGSRVIVNAWAIGRSPAHWDNADKFMPERFEHDDSAAAGFYKAAGPTQFEYLPFGHGRRICPGMGFGVSTLEILVVRLLYYFDWSFPDGMQAEDLDMDMTVGAAARRTNKLHLVASPYPSAHVDLI